MQSHNSPHSGDASQNTSGQKGSDIREKLAAMRKVDNSMEGTSAQKPAASKPLSPAEAMQRILAERTKKIAHQDVFPTDPEHGVAQNGPASTSARPARSDMSPRDDGPKFFGSIDYDTIKEPSKPFILRRPEEKKEPEAPVPPVSPIQEELEDQQRELVPEAPRGITKWINARKLYNTYATTNLGNAQKQQLFRKFDEFSRTPALRALIDDQVLFSMMNTPTAELLAKESAVGEIISAALSLGSDNFHMKKDALEKANLQLFRMSIAHGLDQYEIDSMTLLQIEARYGVNIAQEQAALRPADISDETERGNVDLDDLLDAQDEDFRKTVMQQNAIGEENKQRVREILEQQKEEAEAERKRQEALRKAEEQSLLNKAAQKAQQASSTEAFLNNMEGTGMDAAEVARALSYHAEAAKAGLLNTTEVSTSVVKGKELNVRIPDADYVPKAPELEKPLFTTRSLDEVIASSKDTALKQSIRKAEQEQPPFPESLKDSISAGQFAYVRLYNAGHKKGQTGYVEIGEHPMSSIDSLRIGGLLRLDGKPVFEDYGAGRSYFLIQDVYPVAYEGGEYKKIPPSRFDRQKIRVDLKRRDDMHKEESGLFMILDTGIELQSGQTVELEVKIAQSEVHNLAAFGDSKSKYLVAQLHGNIIAGQPLPVKGYNFAPVKYMYTVATASTSAETKKHTIILEDGTVLIANAVQYAEVHTKFTPTSQDIAPSIVTDLLVHAGKLFLHTVDYDEQQLLFSNVEKHGDDYTVYVMRKQLVGALDDGDQMQAFRYDVLECCYDQEQEIWYAKSRVSHRDGQDMYDVLMRPVDGFLNMYLSHLPVTLDRIESPEYTKLYTRPDTLQKMMQARTSRVPEVGTLRGTFENPHLEQVQRYADWISKISHRFDLMEASMKQHADKRIAEDGDPRHLEPQKFFADPVFRVKGATTSQDPKEFYKNLTPAFKQIFEHPKYGKQMIEAYLQLQAFSTQGYIADRTLHPTAEEFWDRVYAHFYRNIAATFKKIPMKLEQQPFVYLRVKEDLSKRMQKEEGIVNFKDVEEKYYVYTFTSGAQKVKMIYQYSEWDRRSQGQTITQSIVTPYDMYIESRDQHGISEYHPVFPFILQARKGDRADQMRKFWEQFGLMKIDVAGMPVGIPLNASERK